MITALELSAQLGDQVSAHTLRAWARRGLISGAVKLGHKVLFDARTASWLVQDLDGRPFLDRDGKPHPRD